MRNLLKICLFLLLVNVYLICCIWQAAMAGDVREPVWAGSFYPADRAELEKMISRYTTQAAATNLALPTDRSLKAIVMPHAGYIYSGFTAAHASRVLSGNSYRKVLLLGPDHRVGLRNGAVSDAGLFRTPLGFVKLHEDAEQLRNSSPLFRVVQESDRAEHSLEVLLPFLQYYLDAFELVPVVLGSGEPGGFMEALEPLLDNDTLLAVSSDLSHYLPYEEAVRKDRRTIDGIMNLDSSMLAGEDNVACGRQGLLVTLALARKLNWQPVLLHYSNSGDTAGDRQRVVGYAAIAFYGDQKMENSNSPEELTGEQGNALVRLARQTITEKLTGKTDHAILQGPQGALADPVFQNKRGVFVTLHRGGQLRGCIGSLQGHTSIVEGVKSNALNAAFNDYRFRPVTVEELDLIDVEVSILSEPLPLAYSVGDDLLKMLRAGTDGVIIRQGGNSATFLPQVWSQLPDTAGFLSRLCEKAGLPAEAWRKGGLEVMTYQVQYFAEEK